MSVYGWYILRISVANEMPNDHGKFLCGAHNLQLEHKCKRIICKYWLSVLGLLNDVLNLDGRNCLHLRIQIKLNFDMLQINWQHHRVLSWYDKEHVKACRCRHTMNQACRIVTPLGTANFYLPERVYFMPGSKHKVTRKMSQENKWLDGYTITSKISHFCVDNLRFSVWPWKTWDQQTNHAFLCHWIRFRAIWAYFFSFSQEVGKL